MMGRPRAFLRGRREHDTQIGTSDGAMLRENGDVALAERTEY
jgi:hypothetical protein